MTVSRPIAGRRRVSRRTAGRVLTTVGALGIVVSLAGGIVGWSLISHVEAALLRSLGLTSDALTAVEASVAVAEETASTVSEGLAQAERTTRGLEATFQEAEQLMVGTADLTEGQLATSIESFQDSLPALIQAAAVIDGTLRALSALPFGPAYDPDEPFDRSLRRLQTSLEGVPEDLRAQGALIRSTAGQLRQAGRDSTAVADDLAEITLGLERAVRVLRGYSVTTTEAATLLEETRAGLGGRLGTARVILVVLSLTVALGQVVPLGLGWALLQPAGVAALLADERLTRSR